MSLLFDVLVFVAAADADVIVLVVAVVVVVFVIAVPKNCLITVNATLTTLLRSSKYNCA